MAEISAEYLKQVCEQTGLSEREVREHWNRAAANSDALRDCKCHEFDEVDTPAGKKFKCRHCKGEIDAVQMTWYVRGMSDYEKISRKAAQLKKQMKIITPERF